MDWSSLRRLALCLGLCGLAAAPARAWKPTGHVFFAEIARKDALDGKITIWAVDYESGQVQRDSSGNPVVIGEYEVNPDVLEAIRAYPEVYRAGVFGPDAYPDIATGQQVIHPAGQVTPGENDEDLNLGGPGPNAWLEHLWSLAYGDQGAPEDRALKARAFVAGYVTHAAGDMYAHTFVNHFTGGAFHLVENALKHTVLEGYINKRLPPLETYDARIDGLEDFIFRNLTFAPIGSKLQKANLLTGDATSKSLPTIFSRWYNELDAEIKGYYRKKARYQARIDAKLQAAAACDLLDFTCSKAALLAQAGAIQAEMLGWMALNALPTTYKEHWRDDIVEGLKAFPRLSHELARALFFNPPQPGERFGKADLTRVKELINDYVTHHLLSMLGLPDFVGLTVAQVQQIIDRIISDLGIEGLREAIKEMKRDAANFILQSAFGVTLDEIKEYLDSPETVFDRVMNNPILNTEGGTLVSLSDFNTRELRLKDTGFSNPDNPETFDWMNLPPVYNTVTMSKLILLSPKGINDLLRDLGANVTFSGPNAILGFAATLDGSNQWHVNPEKMALARDCAAYQKVFMKQTGESACGAPALNLVPPSTLLTDGQFEHFVPKPPQELDGEAINRQPGDAFNIRDRALFSYTAPQKVTDEATVTIKVSAPDDTNRVARARVKLVDKDTFASRLPLGAGKDGSSFTWTGEGDGVNWTDPCNWQPKESCSDDSKYPGQDPDKDDSAALPGDRIATIQLTEDIRLKNLTVATGARLWGRKTLRIKNDFTWAGGTIGCNLQVLPSGRMTVDQKGDQDYHTLSANDGAGNLILEGDAIWYKGDIRLDLGATIHNKGRFFSRVEDSRLWGNCCVENNVFRNDGELLVLTSPIVSIPPPNTIPIPVGEGRTVEIETPLDPDVSVGPTLPGRMAFSGVGLVNHGRVEVRETCVLHVGIGNHILEDGTVFGGEGRTILAGQNTEARGQLTVEDGATVEMATGLGLRNTATFNGAGTVRWTGGLVYAATEIAPSATLVISGPDTKYLNATYRGGGTLTNQGVVEWDGEGDTVRLDVGATLVNRGLFRVRNRAVLSANCCATNNSFQNEGLLTVLASPDGPAGDKPHAGLLLAGVGLVHKGILELKGDALTMDAGNHVFHQGARLVGPGRARLLGRGLRLEGSVSVEPETTFELGAWPQSTGGILEGKGGFEGGGAFHWTGGIIYGDVEVGPQARLLISGDAGKRLEVPGQNGGGRLTSHGSGEWQGGGPVVFATGAVLTNKGTFTIRQDGTLSSLSCCVSRSTLANQGSLVKESPGTTTLKGVFLDNSGTVELKSGTLTFEIGATLTQTDGATRLWDATLASTTREPVAIGGGLLGGTGKVAANLVNGGVLRPGNPIGSLVVTGDYTQSPTGKLEIQIGGVVAGAGYDQVHIEKNAVLDGLVSVQLSPGFRPAVGDQFSVVRYASRRDPLGTVEGLDLGGGLQLSAGIEPDSLILAVLRQGGVVPGDLTGEGTVGVRDAVLALRLVAGLDTATPEQIEAGDVAPKPGVGPRAGQPFGDGRLGVNDILRLLRRSVGLEPVWP